MPTPTPVTAPPAQRPGGPPAPSGAPSRFNVAIDPVKLIRQHLLLLMFAGVLGVGLGVATQVVLRRTYSLFKGEAAFEYYGVLEGIDQQASTVGVGGGEEIERFVNTQRLIMTSDQLLREAVNDPLIRQESDWAQQFVERSTGRFNSIKAAIELQDIITARAVPDTNIILLNAVATDPSDAANIVNAVVNEYVRRTANTTRIDVLDIEESLTSRLNAIREERRLLEARMERMLLDNNLTSTDETSTREYATIQQALPQLQQLRLELETARARRDSYLELLQAPGGAQFPDEVRMAVREDPIVRTLQNAIADYEAQLRRLNSEYGPNHPLAKRTAKTLEGYQTQLNVERERASEEQFQILVDQTNSIIRQYQQAEADTLETIEEAQRRLSDIKAVLAEREILAKDAERLAETESDTAARLAEYRGMTTRDAAQRFQISYRATPPAEPFFPLWYIVIPAVTVLVVGLVGGGLLAKEIAEQRVRGPADVAIIPRTRMLGVIPDLAEDPSRPESIEKALVTRPDGVVAESIRHVRVGLVKQLQQRGHKTVVVLAGMPGSGATAFLANLAASCAAGEMRVLAIDANLRRPGLHKAFDIPDHPGLADVLSRNCTLADATVESKTQNLFVVPAGSTEHRVTERLMTAAMDQILAEARAEYDLVLIDAPPAIVSSDAMTLAGRCDAAVLVVRAYAEKRGLVARVRTQIEETRAEFVGVVVNAVRASAGGYFRRNFRATHEYAARGKGRDADARRKKKDRKPEEVAPMNGHSKRDN
jgi:capsular exopolysaccharide synthesis family protein